MSFCVYSHFVRYYSDVIVLRKEQSLTLTFHLVLFKGRCWGLHLGPSCGKHSFFHWATILPHLWLLPYRIFLKAAKGRGGEAVFSTGNIVWAFSFVVSGPIHVGLCQLLFVAKLYVWSSSHRIPVACLIRCSAITRLLIQQVLLTVE